MIKIDYNERRKMLLKKLTNINRALKFHIKEFSIQEIHQLYENKKQIINYL